MIDLTTIDYYAQGSTEQHTLIVTSVYAVNLFEEWLQLYSALVYTCMLTCLISALTTRYIYIAFKRGVVAVYVRRSRTSVDCNSTTVTLVQTFPLQSSRKHNACMHHAEKDTI